MRKKLKLDIERLEVEAFETAQATGGRGTVQGRDAASDTCPGTDWISCPYTCEVTCSPACEDTFWRSCWWSCEC
jgi:hypothetical protein